MTRLHAAQARSSPIRRYMAPASLGDALETLADLAPAARPIAGGTDLLLELSRGDRPDVETLVDLSVLDGLDEIVESGGRVELGPLVTHGDVVSWDRMRSVGLPLAQACLEVGSPQLRNRATVAGNLVTASPANDTISALYALDADITMSSIRGDRVVRVEDFFSGFRATVLKPDELITKVTFDALGRGRRGIFVKLGLRRAQAISVVHAAIVASTEADGTVTDLAVALGSVGPTIVVVDEAARLAQGRCLSDVATEVADAARAAVSPINDLRATAKYRTHAVGVVVERALRSLAAGTEAATWPQRPPRLAQRPAAAYGRHSDIGIAVDTSETGASETGTTRQDPELRGGSDIGTDIGNGKSTHRTASGGRGRLDLNDDDVIVVNVNGRARRAANAVGRTLLDWLRDELGLTGSKEGCAEGECGGCTVHLDSRAVLACLMPAARAAGASVTTVEGVALPSGHLHPVQQALVDSGGVQCGFCTPGFVMSAVMLAQEIPRPTREQAEHALAGNLCRCTGYYSILAAVTGDVADNAERRPAADNSPSAENPPAADNSRPANKPERHDSRLASHAVAT